MVIPALAFALVFVGVGVTIAGPKLTGIACVLLACIAVTRGAYHDVFNLRGTASIHNGQLAGPLYVYIGMMIAKYPVAVTWRWWAGLTALGLAMAFVENMVIIQLSGVSLILGHDVIVSTFLLGTFVFILARTLPGSRLAGVLAHTSVRSA